MEQKISRATRTTAQALARQKADAEGDRLAAAKGAQQAAALQSNGGSAVKALPAEVAVSDNRTLRQAYLDEIAPASLVGRQIKFGKDGRFVTADDSEPIGDDVDFVALPDQTLIGYMRFNGEGEPPDRRMGLLYDGYIMPPRATLGDTDVSQWEIGLDGKPADPWQHFIYLVLQRGTTARIISTSSTAASPPSASISTFPWKNSAAGGS